MADAPYISPAVTFLTAGEKKARDTKEAIRNILATVTHDIVLLATVIAEGPLVWRNNFFRAMAGLAVNDEVADRCYMCFCDTWRTQYGETSTHEVLDQIHVPSPLTEKEIEDAWEHDASSSSWDARRRFYMDEPPKLGFRVESSMVDGPAAAPAPVISGSDKPH